jgi:hypothetical protein
VDSSRSQKRKTSWRNEFKKYAAVAVFTGIIAIGYLSYYSLGGRESYPVLTPGDEQITLQLDNGAVKVIGEEFINLSDEQGKIIGTGDGRRLVYNPGTTAEKSEYNIIKVPYGKQFELSLADGTRVHLNAGTSFKYPVNFIKGKNREVFLTGEAYFDVARDELHPFIVNAEALKVEVLGTEFNVAAYPEDSQAFVVLVEGSVGMFSEGETYQEDRGELLSPNHKGSFNKEQNSFSKEEVVTGVYTSWIKGELIFRDVTFAQMIKRLERHYNIPIVNLKEDVTDETFNANFGNEPIEKVLEYLTRIYQIDYTISDNQIIIEN